MSDRAINPVRASWMRDRSSSPNGKTWSEALTPLKRSPFVYGCTVVFFFLYYYRPEDFIHPLGYIPMAKIAGILGFLGLLAGMSSSKAKMPPAMTILWLLFIQMMLTVPFALWPGGALHNIIDKYAKGVVVTMLISMIVVTIGELRRLLWIQVSAVVFVTFASIVTRHYNDGGRLSGVQESILSNPNDLAINIAISFPLCVAFMLQQKGFWKIVWGASLGVLAVGVVLTSSRSGLLALILSIVTIVWEYGIKGKRRSLVFATILVSILGFAIALSSSHYRARVASIVMGDVEGSGDSGSRAARLELLEKSAMVAATHPLFGVGPGCFPIVDKAWHVAHNAYTEIAAEAGIPALILFLLAMRAAFKNIALLRISERYRDDEEFRLLTQALWAGLVGFMAGSFFASTEYNLYPYFVIGYTCAMVRIISASSSPNNKENAIGMKSLDSGRTWQKAWSR
jgi:O-antigen ligase